MTRTYRLTTDHAASSYGVPVLVDEDGVAYGPDDYLPDGRHAWEYVEGQRAVRMGLVRPSSGPALQGDDADVDRYLGTRPAAKEQ